MQIDLLAARGPKFATTGRTEHPASDRLGLAAHFPGKTFTRAIASFVNRLRISDRAATNSLPLIPMPPRRRNERPPPQGKSGFKGLPRTADPTVPEPTVRHRSRPPSDNPAEQKSPHHQARDTLQGDEGA